MKSRSPSPSYSNASNDLPAEANITEEETKKAPEEIDNRNENSSIEDLKQKDTEKDNIIADDSAVTQEETTQSQVEERIPEQTASKEDDKDNNKDKKDLVIEKEGKPPACKPLP